MMRQIEWRRVANHFEGAIDILFAARPWAGSFVAFIGVVGISSRSNSWSALS
jgi:hypothetical protein